jgi:hypothetical protein
VFRVSPGFGAESTEVLDGTSVEEASLRLRVSVPFAESRVKGVPTATFRATRRFSRSATFTPKPTVESAKPNTRLSQVLLMSLSESVTQVASPFESVSALLVGVEAETHISTLVASEAVGPDGEATFVLVLSNSVVRVTVVSLVYRTFSFSTLVTARVRVSFAVYVNVPAPRPGWSNGQSIAFVTGALTVVSIILCVLVAQRRWKKAKRGSKSPSSSLCDEGGPGEDEVGIQPPEPDMVALETVRQWALVSPGASVCSKGARRIWTPASTSGRAAATNSSRRRWCTRRRSGGRSSNDSTQEK